MVLAVDHVDMVVRDLEKHVSFFEMLGFKVISRTQHGGGAVELQLPGRNQVIFELHQASALRTIGIHHIAFRVETVQSAYEQLKANGTPMADEPHVNQFSGRLVANFRDPDGWVLQLAEAGRKPTT